MTATEIDDTRQHNRGRELACINFEPRPDNPAEGDQQTAFMTSQHSGVTFLLGGNGAGTTTCGLAKAVQFMCSEQEPPRKDTPFWIIASTYPQVCGACWKEKLHLQGHLHPNDVDWERINWYKPNNDWPFIVHLKPWAGRPGRNWSIYFKSYEQGRTAMQAESIGGFLFVEQFPWGLLEETLRGCREYAFTGNKLAEFTPVEPSLSMELRQMEEENELPEDWAIYRANTDCARKAGHVTEQWFKTFFGMVPPMMRDVRMKGLWGSFVGAIYPEWNPLIHCTGKDWDIPPACHHRRSIDFGFSADHAFVCLWGCYDSIGRWVIYDEYYCKEPKSVIEHWIEIARRHPWPKENPYYGTTYCDHDMDAIITLQQIHNWVEEIDSPNLTPASKAINAGIEHVKMLLAPTLEIVPGEKEARLKVVKKACPNLCREIITYRRPKQIMTGPNAQAPTDAPVKIDDHCMDAMRMLLYSEATHTGTTIDCIGSTIPKNKHGIQLDRYGGRRQS